MRTLLAKLGLMKTAAPEAEAETSEELRLEDMVSALDGDASDPLVAPEAPSAEFDDAAQADIIDAVASEIEQSDEDDSNIFGDLYAELSTDFGTSPAEGAEPLAEPQGQHIEGTDGDDILRMDSGDTVTGGEGADTFVAGTWVDPGAPAQITDFDPAEDALVIEFTPGADDKDAEAGEVTIGIEGVDAIVMLNGQPVIQVNGGAGNVTRELVHLVQAS